jgi:hypothetical protein
VCRKSYVAWDEYCGYVRMKAGVSFIDEDHPIVQRNPEKFRPADGPAGKRIGGREAYSTMFNDGRAETVVLKPEARPMRPAPVNARATRAGTLSYAELQKRRGASGHLAPLPDPVAARAQRWRLRGADEAE